MYKASLETVSWPGCIKPLTLHIVPVGSEGSLGIVTKVSILTPPKLSSVNVAFLACKDYISIQA